MAYDEGLADRVRSVLRGHRPLLAKGLREKRMFGGLVFMIDGNMCCGVRNSELMLRMGLEEAKAVLARPHTRPLDHAGKRMTRFVFVNEQGTDLDRDLEELVEMALAFVATLEPKDPSAKPKRRVPVVKKPAR
jgi:TfoX/Sxy family transcriptional regulator of competence genes